MEIDVFALGTFAAEDGDTFPGLVRDGRVHDLRDEFGRASTTATMLADWGSTLTRLHELARSLTGGVPAASLRPLPPIQPVGQLFCAGANYRKHLAEIAFSMARNDPGERRSQAELRATASELVERRRLSGTPFVFAMPPSTVSGARDDIVLWGPGYQHDWELELALAIGRPARNVSAAEAMDYVAGYTMSNDVSTRDVLVRPHLPMTDFLVSKGRPGFFPTGPYLVPREFVEDYRALRLTLTVNDEVMQDEYVRDIIYGVEELVAYLSTITELRPGDVVLTGSPGGNAGHHGDRWLRPGDVVEGRITGLGVMRNRCVADPNLPGQHKYAKEHR
ncbi:fumarylacetoacetate hydrolase family protein [Pseudonocardia kujensis]|uniref:fumarylacetoacetate hydrolase family protein n=1 Tax=Pseudonocardia kujensis TaxID=1128675 RepID=UPI001E3320CC|nr:fumarylacetoacetate hydrolase family protein [Pseudonocardia kujensis]MCE0766878.1 fumarylacetoacetate hydrolase family protein [Pseudonocardia kujensis]